jgi:hypothetical protein
VDSSTISKNMKRAKHPTLNREPDNLSSYERSSITDCAVNFGARGKTVDNGEEKDI